MFKQIVIAARGMEANLDPKGMHSPASLPVCAADKPPVRTDRTCDIEIPSNVWSPCRVDGEPRPVIRALMQHEQLALTKRQGDLISALVPFTNAQTDRVALAISDMFAGFRSVTRNIDAESAVAMIDGIRRLLAPLPAWAIEEGCRDIQRGKAGLDHKFLPNDNEIYDVIERLVKPYRDRLLECEALLSAPVESNLSKTG
ncbi:MAG: hypothetical protein WDN48_05935 [Pseudolabrys sp.]